MSHDFDAIIIGPAGLQGFYLVTGFNGMVFKLFPAVGLCVVEWMVDGASRSVDIAGFDRCALSAATSSRASTITVLSGVNHSPSSSIG